MAHHIICLTIDIDPDGLSAQTVNRSEKSFKCFEQIMELPEFVISKLNHHVPLTWFLRIDKQIEEFFGDEFYLLSRYNNFFSKISSLGHEIAWHPHLYIKSNEKYELPLSDEIACILIQDTFNQIKKNNLRFKSFRNGEGWHSNVTMNLIRELGFNADSTALPKLYKSSPHLLNWKNTDNAPYYPSKDNYQLPGEKSSLLEIPMNTWFVKASYDKQSRLRYMNPAVHENVFANSLIHHKEEIINEDQKNKIWTFITHPDELVPKTYEDLLHSSSMLSYVNNIKSFTDLLEQHGNTFEFSTIDNASMKWKSN